MRPFSLRSPANPPPELRQHRFVLISVDLAPQRRALQCSGAEIEHEGDECVELLVSEGHHPTLTGDSKIVAVSCKSWQSGFNLASAIAASEKDKLRRGRKAWQTFRELTVQKWSEAFTRAIHDATGTDRFTYILAIAKLSGDNAMWESYEAFSDALGGNPLTILTFPKMVTEIQSELTTTLAATEVGRMLQLFHTAGIPVEQD